MRFLLDTCAFLWLAAEPGRLPTTIVDMFRQNENEFFLSAASAWEITIKYKLEKLELPDSPDRYIPDRLARYRLSPLQITLEHVIAAGMLPLHHNDPFDRLLIAQADIEELTIVTPDAAFSRYTADLVW